MRVDPIPRALRFRAGGLELAVMLEEIAQIAEPAPVLPVPYAHPALAGLWIGDGAQTPIFELRGLVDPRAPFDASLPVSAYAIFDTEVGPIGLRVEAVRGTVEDYALEEERASSDVEPALLPALSGLAEVEGEAFHFFSPGAFLAALDVLRPLKP